MKIVNGFEKNVSLSEFLVKIHHLIIPYVSEKNNQKVLLTSEACRIAKTQKAPKVRPYSGVKVSMP